MFLKFEGLCFSEFRGSMWVTRFLIFFRDEPRNSYIKHSCLHILLFTFFIYSSNNFFCFYLFIYFLCACKHERVFPENCVLQHHCYKCTYFARIYRSIYQSIAIYSYLFPALDSYHCIFLYI